MPYDVKEYKTETADWYIIQRNQSLKNARTIIEQRLDVRLNDEQVEDYLYTISKRVDTQGGSIVNEYYEATSEDMDYPLLNLFKIEYVKPDKK